jgi:hypothetical protein
LIIRPLRRPSSRRGLPGVSGPGSVLFVLALLLPLPGCDSPLAGDGPTLLRIANETGMDLEELHVFVDPPIHVSLLPAGEVTDYEEMELAYRYATVTATANGAELILQAIDFVGEVPLGPGRFTYRLGLVEGSTDQLVLELVQDD